LTEANSKIVFRKGNGFTGCGKTLYGREDVSGHGFIRAEKINKIAGFSR